MFLVAHHAVPSLDANMTNLFTADFYLIGAGSSGLSVAPGAAKMRAETLRPTEAEARKSLGHNIRVLRADFSRSYGAFG